MIKIAAAVLALAVLVLWGAVMSLGKVAADFVWRIVERIRNRPKAVARRAARTARKAKRQRQPDEAAGEFFQPEEEREMLNGYKTYLGIGVTLLGVALGWLGVGEAEAGTLAAQIVGALDQVLTVAGLALAAYGRVKAKPSA